MGASIPRDVAAFARDLAIVDLDGPPIFEMLTERLMLLLDAEGSVAYSTRCEDTGSSLQRFSIRGLGASVGTVVEQGLGEWIRRASGAFSFYDPRSPEPEQRNAALVIGSWRTLAENALPSALSRARISPDERERRHRSLLGARSVFARWGSIDAIQMRVLVCEGPALLAWVGIVQHGSVAAHQKRKLAALVPAIQRRLAVEVRLSSPTTALLPAVLDEIGSEAYLLDGAAQVVSTNTLGRRALASEGRELRASLRAARKGNDPRFTSLDLATRGVPGHALVIKKLGRAALTPSVVRGAASELRLTARETQVLEHVARGRTNRSIAVALDCSERTVETHVSRILGKAGAPSRAVLVAIVWTLAARG